MPVIEAAYKEYESGLRRYLLITGMLPPLPPCTVAADSGERDDVLARIVELIRSPAARIRSQLSTGGLTCTTPRT